MRNEGKHANLPPAIVSPRSDKDLKHEQRDKGDLRKLIFLPPEDEIMDKVMNVAL